MPLIARSVPEDALREIEHRAGVMNLDTVLEQRNGLVPYFARLDAIVGPGGTKDDDLASYWHVLEAQHRHEMQEKGEKITESALDTRVYADRRYIAKLEEFRSLREQWVLVKNELDGFEKRIQWALALMRYATSEPKT